MLEIGNSNDENVKYTNATDINDKYISTESNNEPNIEIGLDTAQSEPLTTQEARDENFSLNTDNNNVSFDTNKNAFDLIKEY